MRFAEFCDGSVLAQLGFPTMELPILYALTHPARLPDAGTRRFDPVAAGPLTFEPVRTDVFRAFTAGVAAGRAGGTAPAVFNAANEIAVAAFLAGSITFGRIADVIERVLDAASRRPRRPARGGSRGRSLGPRAGPGTGGLMLFTLGAFLVVLGVLVFIHELGHFLAAKAAGIMVHRFSLGMGSPIPWLTRKWGETEYAISWLPLGGYVKMATSESDATSSALEGAEPEETAPVERRFESKPVWQRMIVILAGVTMNVLFAFAAFTWLAFHNGRQIDPTTVVGRVTLDSLPASAAGLEAVHPGHARAGGQRDPRHLVGPGRRRHRRGPGRQRCPDLRQRACTGAGHSSRPRRRTGRGSPSRSTPGDPL